MQTVADSAKEIVSWELRLLQNGAYRISNARRLKEAPVVDLYTERIDIAQFTDSLACVKEVLGLTDGEWVGLERRSGSRVEVIAMKME